MKKTVKNNISSGHSLIDKKINQPSGHSGMYIRLEVEALQLSDEALRTSSTVTLVVMLMLLKFKGLYTKAFSPNLLSYLASSSHYEISAVVSGAHIMRVYGIQQSDLDEHVHSGKLYSSEEDNGMYYDWDKAKILFATS